MREKTLAQYMCYQLLRDSIWKTSKTIIPDARLSESSAAAHHRTANTSRTVDEVIQLRRVRIGWRNLYNEIRLKPFSGHWLGIIDPDRTCVPIIQQAKSISGEKAAIELFINLWPVDHVVAQLAASNILLHDNIGMLVVQPEHLKDIDELVKTQDLDAIAYTCIERIPGGITDERIAKNDRCLKQAS